MEAGVFRAVLGSRRCAVDWWVWLLVAVAVVIVLTGLTLWVQARRRGGGVIATHDGSGHGSAGRKGGK
ncbi:hypothetical protein JJV70_20825 [Streptomyces sp. JJ66]|nr:hypothetical protein [Streptomyces sp. JJ66]